MGENYTVQQGDHLSAIAAQFGFAKFETIWNRGENDELRAKRDNPHVLLPGDQVYIPDLEPKTDMAPTTKVNVYQVYIPKLLLRLALKDFDDQPLPDTNCVVEVDGKPEELVSDGQGIVETWIPRTARSGVLRVPDLDLEVPFGVGHLDPVDEKSGWVGRLINLGYYVGTIDDVDDQQLGFAVEEFQCDHQLTVSGELDEITRAKLKEMHGS